MIIQLINIFVKTFRLNFVFLYVRYNRNYVNGDLSVDASAEQVQILLRGIDK